MPRIRLTEKIAKTASFIERLDKIASELEQVDPRIALAIDQVSDRLESRKADTVQDQQMLYCWRVMVEEPATGRDPDKGDFKSRTTAPYYVATKTKNIQDAKKKIEQITLKNVSTEISKTMGHVISIKPIDGTDNSIFIIN